MKTDIHVLPHPVEITVVQDGQILVQRSYQTTPIRLGRLTENDLVIPTDFISRSHAEFRYDGKEWTVVDLGSRHGLIDASGTRQEVIRLGNSAKFSIDRITVSFRVKTRAKASFAAAKERSAVRPKHAANVRVSSQSKNAHSQPVLNVDAKMDKVHAGLATARERALQMNIIWHDQLLETYEFPVGKRVKFQWLGRSHSLGRVGEKQTRLKFSGTKGAVKVDVNLPIVVSGGDSVALHFRYIPRSRMLPVTEDWIDPRFVDPIMTSSVIHLSIALTSLFAPGKAALRVPLETPNHFAHIVMPPPPAPEPPPPPPPEPPPPPVEVVKEEPPPPPPKEVPKPPPPKKKVVVQKKLRKVALTKKEDVEKVKTDEPKKPDSAPVKVEKTAEAEAPKPQPVDVKKIGALAALSILKDTPGKAVANVESIQVSRAPSNESGELIGAKAVAGTGQIISTLSQSTGDGKGTGTIGIQSDKVKGYSAGGLSGHAGKRKVLGSVLGGATYTELATNEGLTREQVMKEVQKHQAQFQQCYERGLLDNPDLAGRAEFEWQITPAGAVTAVTVKSTTLKSGEGLLTCVQGIFRKMKFPVAKNGESTTPTIGLPFGRL